MTQEDKELLLKDLCPRLPYGVKCAIFNKDLGFEGKYPFVIDGITQEGDDIDVWIEHGNFSLETVKPYLFPLSSMTEEQKEELKHEISKQTDILIERMKNNDCGIDCGKYHFHSLLELEWCLKNHFDIYGLIPKGLANDATGLNIY